MSEQTQKQLQLYVDAAKLDMLELFQKPVLNIFEFRRLADICEIMINLCDSASGGFISPNAVHTALWASEVKALTLHSALGGHVFDANELLKDKYERMAKEHEQLRLKLAYAKQAEYEFTTRAAHLDASLEEIGVIEKALGIERRQLAARAAELERRELALAAGEAAPRQLAADIEVEIVDEDEGDAP